MTPEGAGYLHIPADTPHGFVAVYTFYHPSFRTAVIDERAFKVSHDISRDLVLSENIIKNLDAGTCCVHIVQKQKTCGDVRVLQSDKPYTGLLDSATHFGD